MPKSIGYEGGHSLYICHFEAELEEVDHHGGEERHAGVARSSLPEATAQLMEMSHVRFSAR